MEDLSLPIKPHILSRAFINPFILFLISRPPADAQGPVHYRRSHSSKLAGQYAHLPQQLISELAADWVLPVRELGVRKIMAQQCEVVLVVLGELRNKTVNKVAAAAHIRWKFWFNGINQFSLVGENNDRYALLYPPQIHACELGYYRRACEAINFYHFFASI